jgi:hypothetical protein
MPETGNSAKLANNSPNWLCWFKKYMATIHQIDANRRNALKSTGPKTPEGKAAVSMNALQHGLRARTVVLPTENHQEFHQLCEDLEAEWNPQSRTEQFYLEQMAVSQWKLTRMEVGEATIFREASTSKNQTHLLESLWQAQGRMERSYARAQRELERLQNSRRSVVQAVSPDQPVAETTAPNPTPFPPVEPDPRTAGRPHRDSTLPAGYSTQPPG